MKNVPGWWRQFLGQMQAMAGVAEVINMRWVQGDDGGSEGMLRERVVPVLERASLKDGRRQKW